jgi:hypothetical protein
MAWLFSFFNTKPQMTGRILSYDEMMSLIETEQSKRKLRFL